MSTSPDLSRSVADDLVSLLSRWLAGHVSDDTLRAELELAEVAALGGEAAELVGELLAALRDPGGSAGTRSMLARETIQALFEL